MESTGIGAIVLATIAFFAVGAVWYGPLFGKLWQREMGLSDADLKNANMALIFGLSFAFEMLVVTVYAHLLASTSPSAHVIMMMAVGFGASIMAPAIGINYLYQRRSGLLFAIDAGHFVVGMLAVGAVFLALA